MCAYVAGMASIGYWLPGAAKEFTCRFELHCIELQLASRLGSLWMAQYAVTK